MREVSVEATSVTAKAATRLFSIQVTSLSLTHSSCYSHSTFRLLHCHWLTALVAHTLHSGYFTVTDSQLLLLTLHSGYFTVTDSQLLLLTLSIQVTSLSLTHSSCYSHSPFRLLHCRWLTALVTHTLHSGYFTVTDSQLLLLTLSIQITSLSLTHSSCYSLSIQVTSLSLTHSSCYSLSIQVTSLSLTHSSCYSLSIQVTSLSLTHSSFYSLSIQVTSLSFTHSSCYSHSLFRLLHCHWLTALVTHTQFCSLVACTQLKPISLK